jgi:hypothetical protein
MSDHTDRIIREYSPPQPPSTGGVVVIVLLVIALVELVRWWLR